MANYGYAIECPNAPYGAYATETFQIVNTQGQPVSVQGLTVQEFVSVGIVSNPGYLPQPVPGSTGWVSTTRPGPTTTNAAGQFIDSPFGSCDSSDGGTYSFYQSYRVQYNGRWYFLGPVLDITELDGFHSLTVSVTTPTGQPLYSFDVNR